MPHADSAALPDQIKTKSDFWEHILVQLNALLEGNQHWISNLANASSLIYHSLRSYDAFGTEEKSVNWCGFYIASRYMPGSSSLSQPHGQGGKETILLGPFSGKPACQFIRVPSEPKDQTQSLTGSGVCADSYYFKKTLRVPDVDAYPGHIACDGETKSEIVIPIYFDDNSSECVGVLDLDCLAMNGFNEEDQRGLEAIARLISKSCDWVKSG